MAKTLESLLRPRMARRKTFLDAMSQADRVTAFELRRAYHAGEFNGNTLPSVYAEFRPPCSQTTWMRFCLDADGILYPEPTRGKKKKRR